MSDDNSHQPLEFIPPSVDHLAGLLPAYSFDKLIAKGGMGAVYKATQTSLERPVAVKVLPPELGESETFRESFIKEAKLMARLNHPNLISVFDFGEVENMLYIVMEFVNGATLYEKTYDGHLDQQEALEVTIAICRGLANAHDAGILHRDIKPANIFITESGTPKVGDFGLARPSSDTETGVIFGTPGYTAPEVLAAPDTVGSATDIFAVGVMLYELLAGKIPADIYEPVTKYSKCDPMIDRLIRKAIAPKLTQRYSSAENFADDLEDIFRNAKKGHSKSNASPRLITNNNSKTKKTPHFSTGKHTALAASSPIKIGRQSANQPTTSTLLATPAAKKPAKKPANLANSSKVKTSRTSKTGLQSPPQKVVTAGRSANARNFIIIIVLLCAIYGVLQWKDAKEAKNARIEEQNEKLANARLKPTLPESSQTSVDKTPVDIKPITRKTLEQLRTRLVEGNRPINEMPKETLSLDNGERLILFIDKELTWHQAQLWANKHGAQLATVGSSSDVSALRKAIPSGENAWIGAATAGYKQWAWTDGTPWNDSIAIRQTSKLAFAQLDSDMFAAAKKSGDTAKFLIEWKTDSSQPAALEQQMERVAATLDNPTPLYPPGSFTFTNRSYYLCPHPLTLIQAQKLAKSAGAQIATPSDDVETAYYSDLISSNVPSGRLCRIGGILDSNEWKWLSGEEWKSATWDDNYPKNLDSIVIVSSSTSKWRDASQNERVAYTLFEWSKDAPTSGAITLRQNNGPSSSEFTKFQLKASELVKDAYDKHEKEYAENVKRLRWDLEFHFKGLPKNEKARQARSIQKIKELMGGEDRIKKSVSGMGNSAKVKKITADAYEKQVRIETAYEESIDKVRIGYQNKLRTIIQGLESKDQLTAAKQAKAVLKASSSGIDAFIQLFK